MTGPIPVTHVGSLVRPPELRSLLERRRDGEFGKSISWSQYVMERLGGFEFRPRTVPGTARAIGGKDRRDFAEFYDEYEGALGVAGIGKGSIPPGDWAMTEPVRYVGAAAVAGDIARLEARHLDGGPGRGGQPRPRGHIVGAVAAEPAARRK